MGDVARVGMRGPEREKALGRRNLEAVWANNTAAQKDLVQGTSYCASLNFYPLPTNSIAWRTKADHELTEQLSCCRKLLRNCSK